jgi:hypothetical protein
MSNLFRVFLTGASARGGYCLDCLSEMYGEPARTVTRYLNEIGVSGRPPDALIAARRRRPPAPIYLPRPR